MCEPNTNFNVSPEFVHECHETLTSFAVEHIIKELGKEYNKPIMDYESTLLNTFTTDEQRAAFHDLDVLLTVWNEKVARHAFMAGLAMGSRFA